MIDCLDIFNHHGQNFQYDHCSNVITKTLDSEDYNFTRESLKQLSSECFDAYKFRLREISETMFKIGQSEYDIINTQLINNVLTFEPLNYSFSITNDPSLHFFVKFENQISLFIETFLEMEESHDTYVQIHKGNHVLLQLNCSFDDALEKINTVLSREVSKKSDTYTLPLNFG